jgi:hypothetical protein
MMTEFDAGRYLHLILVVDHLEGFSIDGLAGMNRNPEQLSGILAKHVEATRAMAEKEPGFRGGMSLMVSCGYGRGFGMEFEVAPREKWRMEALSAYNLHTLSWLPDFDVLPLWRLLEARSALRKVGVRLFNVNGLANLVAWAQHLDGHLIPHSQLPENFGADHGENVFVVPQDAIREIRRTVEEVWDNRRVEDPGRRWLKVSKLDQTEFAEDRVEPLYGSVDDAKEGRLRAVYLARKRPWWIGITAPDEAPRERIFEFWRMLGAWLKRFAPVLDEAFAGVPDGPMAVEVAFAKIGEANRLPPASLDIPALRSLLKISATPGVSLLRIDVGASFEDGFFRPENFAERSLVEAIVRAVAVVANEGEDEHKQEQLLETICPDTQGRVVHYFEARSYRD